MKLQTLPVLLVSFSLASLPILGAGCGLFDDKSSKKDDDDKDDDKDEDKDKDKSDGGDVDPDLAKMRFECAEGLKGIKTAQLVYDADYDEFINASSFHPDSSPGKKKREFTTGSAFDTLGWAPDEPVRGSYKVVTTSTTDFKITCITDVDGDGEKATFTATKTINATLNTPNNVY